MKIIVATDLNGAIGRNGQLLCHNKEDMRFFKEKTMEKHGCTKIPYVIMGRKTAESLPNGYLPKRINIVLSKNSNYILTAKTIMDKNPDAIIIVMTSVEETMNYLYKEMYDNNLDSKMESVSVIGGGMIYKEFIPYCDKIYCNVFLTTCEDADTFFPREIDVDKFTYVRRKSDDNEFYYFDVSLTRNPNSKYHSVTLKVPPIEFKQTNINVLNFSVN